MTEDPSNVEESLKHKYASWFKAQKDASQQIERIYRLTTSLPVVGDTLQTMDEELGYKSPSLYIESRSFLSYSDIDSVEITYAVCAEYLIYLTPKQPADPPVLEH